MEWTVIYPVKVNLYILLSVILGNLYAQCSYFLNNFLRNLFVSQKSFEQCL